MFYPQSCQPQSYQPQRGHRFSSQEDETLLVAVGSFPALYDPSHPDYRNCLAKADIWANIAAMMARDVEQCKRRWKDIKDNYYKIRRKHKLTRCKWPLVGFLTFLDGLGPERRIGWCTSGWGYRAGDQMHESRGDFRDTNKQGMAENTDHPSRESEAMPMDGVSEGAEDKQQCCQCCMAGDEVGLFMQSVTVQMKELTPEQRAQAKLSILRAVNDLQFQEQYSGTGQNPEQQSNEVEITELLEPTVEPNTASMHQATASSSENVLPTAADALPQPML